MKRKLVSLMSICLTSIMLMAGCGSSKEESKTKDTFKVGLEAAYAPYNWTQMDASNGGVKIEGSSEYAGGYDVEMAKKVAKGLGKELVIVKVEWDGLIPSLVSGKIDAIVAGMSPTEKRKETIDFSNNYYTSDLVVVVKSGSKYESSTSIQDFKGAKITAQLNTLHYDVIDQIKGVQRLTAMDSFSAMRVALQSGTIDGYVSERPEGISAELANKDFKMVQFKDGFNVKKEELSTAIGLQKNSKLKDEINKVLSGISEQERAAIMENAIKNQPAAK